VVDLGFSISKDASWQVTQFSRNANNGTNASRFYWNLNNTSANLNANISSQVSLFQLI